MINLPNPFTTYALPGCFCFWKEQTMSKLLNYTYLESLKLELPNMSFYSQHAPHN